MKTQVHPALFTPHPPMSISIDQNAQLAQFVRFADAAADKDVVS